MKTKKEKPKLGDYFYYPNESDKNHGGRSLRYKINFLKNNVFEFGTIQNGRTGWGSVSDLVVNPNKKSKVKWVFISGIAKFRKLCYI